MTQANAKNSTSHQAASEKNGKEAKSTSQGAIYSLDVTNEPKKLEGYLFNPEVIARFNRWPQHPPEKDAANAGTIRNKKSNTSNNVSFTDCLSEVKFPFLSPEALKRFNERPQHPPEKDTQ